MLKMSDSGTRYPVLGVPFKKPSHGGLSGEPSDAVPCSVTGGRKKLRRSLGDPTSVGLDRYELYIWQKP